MYLPNEVPPPAPELSSFTGTYTAPANVADVSSIKVMREGSTLSIARRTRTFRPCSRALSPAVYGLLSLPFRTSLFFSPMLQAMQSQSTPSGDGSRDILNWRLCGEVDSLQRSSKC